MDIGRHVLEPTDSPETYFQVIFLTLVVFWMHSCHKKFQTRSYAFDTTTITTINKLDNGRHVLEPTDSPETYFQVIFLTLGVFWMHSRHKKVKTRNYTTTISTINKIDSGRHVQEPTDSPET